MVCEVLVDLRRRLVAGDPRGRSSPLAGATCQPKRPDSASGFRSEANDSSRPGPAVRILVHSCFRHRVPGGFPQRVSHCRPVGLEQR